jgi:hypothetical protein
MPKTRSTLVMDEELWKRFRMIAILNDMEVSELVEQALREKLERMKQLEQYDAYKDVEKLHVTKGTQQPQIQPQQLQQSRQDSVITLTLRLPGIEFPADKSKIQEYAKEANPIDANDPLRFISDRKYKNKSDLENELSSEAKTSKAPLAIEIAKKGGTIIFEIDNRKLRREQQEEIVSKQENEIGSIMKH